MVKSGRTPRDPRGATDAANDVARFLRELTDGMSLRELAERYEGGKTLWGEYRSGAQLIPLPRLNSVVKDRVRDARGRETVLAKARRLHELAMTAVPEDRPDIGLGEALQRAKQDIADMGRLIKALLARIDVLEGEAARQPAAAEGADLSGRPAEMIAAQLDALREQVAEARRVREETLKAYGAARSRAGEEPDDEDASAAPGSELIGSLAALHDTAARQQDALRGWSAEGSAPAPGTADADAGAVGAGAAVAGGTGGVREDGAHRGGGADAEGGAAHDGVAARDAVDASGGPVPAAAADANPRVDGAGGTSPDGMGAGRGSSGAEVGPVGHGPGQDGARRRGLRLPAGIGLVVLVAACVVGGMAISEYRRGAGDHSPETRLDTPATPGNEAAAPPAESPGPQTSPSGEPSPGPSASAPAPEPGEEQPAPPATPKPEGSVPAAPPKTQEPEPAPKPAPVVGGGLRSWVNAGTQMCLEIRRSAGEDGATANQWTCNNSSSQKWTTTNPGGSTTLVHMDSGKCLEIRADSVEDGATANQWSCNGSPTQSWRWRAQPGGGWSLVNANSGKCLSIRGQGDGALAVQQPCDGSPLQTWN
ncbi:RICIN domain-containing protein [Streptomyces sp. NPDC059708]|uniref:RICIN domain-containing protein n=2 Tax=unclassified Streptomyces TaxID=2593676 RepID=UPI00368B9167